MKRYQPARGSANWPDTLAESAFCIGDACAVVSVRWDPGAGSYLVCNGSARSVRVQFKTWPSPTTLLLPPDGQARLHAETLEYPYYASYE